VSLLERYTQPAEAQIPTVSHHGDIPGYLELMAKWQHVVAARLVK
jgi:hypothetical protein